jgi:hypothetical protein
VWNGEFYGVDWEAPCSTEVTMEESRMAVLEVEEREVGCKSVVGVNRFSIFPAAAKRAGRSGLLNSRSCEMSCVADKICTIAIL